MATAYRNKFAARCEVTGKWIPKNVGWVVPVAENGAQRWRPICDEIARKEGHKLEEVSATPKRGGKGVTTGLEVTGAWRWMFRRNEDRAAGGTEKPWTDEQISQFMQSEFPASSADSKSAARVRMFRSNYNRGAHSFSEFGEPDAAHVSHEYDATGAKVGDRPKPSFGSGGVSETRVREIARELDSEVAAVLRQQLQVHEKPVVHVAFHPKKVKKVDTGGKHKRFLDVLKRVEAGLPVLLVGPSGSGKTFLAAQVAEALDMDFTFNSMSEGVSESSLLGRMLPDAKGAWTYQPAPFVSTFKKGGVHLLDEIDASDPNLLVTVNAAIANGLLSLPFAGIEPIKRHERCVIIAAANTYGNGADRQYVGRNQLDAATLNRFTMGTVEIDYDREIEAAIVREILEGDSGKAESLLRWSWGVREKVEANRLRRIMSTRNIEDAAKLMAVGVDLPTVQKTYLLGWSADEARKVG